MEMKEELSEKRAVFFEFVQLLKEHKILAEDIISMGNLALFIDYSIYRYKWEDKKQKIELFAKAGDKNEVNMLLAGYLYDIAKNLDISDNLEFKLEKMSLAYKENKLAYFDVVLDPYEFPEWFKWVMEYYPSISKKSVHNNLLKRLESHRVLVTKENRYAFTYFVDRVYPKDEYLKKITELDLMLRIEETNELAWFIAQTIFKFYYPELQGNPSQQTRALQQLTEYKNRYKHNRLKEFDFFQETNPNLRLLED